MADIQQIVSSVSYRFPAFECGSRLAQTCALDGRRPARSRLTVTPLLTRSHRAPIKRAGASLGTRAAASTAAARTETAKPTASDGATSDHLGVSVVIDGDTIVAGAFLDDVSANTDQGSAYILSPDDDGVPNVDDNCQLESNPDQADQDGDGQGRRLRQRSRRRHGDKHLR